MKLCTISGQGEVMTSIELQGCRSRSKVKRKHICTFAKSEIEIHVARGCHLCSFLVDFSLFFIEQENLTEKAAMSNSAGAIMMVSISVRKGFGNIMQRIRVLIFSYNLM